MTNIDLVGGVAPLDVDHLPVLVVDLLAGRPGLGARGRELVGEDELLLLERGQVEGMLSVGLLGSSFEPANPSRCH